MECFLLVSNFYLHYHNSVRVIESTWLVNFWVKLGIRGTDYCFEKYFQLFSWLSRALFYKLANLKQVIFRIISGWIGFSYHSLFPYLFPYMGYVFQLKWKEDPGYIVINGTNFNLKQCHWHSPSEHTFNGSRSFLLLLFSTSWSEMLTSFINLIQMFFIFSAAFHSFM